MKHNVGGESLIYKNGKFVYTHGNESDDDEQNTLFGKQKAAYNRNGKTE